MFSVRPQPVAVLAAAVACASSEPPTSEPPRKDEPIDIHQFRHASDDDPPPVGPAGHDNTYWQHLVAEVHQVWEIPQISKVNGAAVGCFHIAPDGKILSVKFDPSGDQAFDASVQRALTKVQQARNDNPLPVPTEQLGVIRKWVCFRFNVNP